MTNTEKFLSKYAEIEQLTKQKYHLGKETKSPIVYLEGRSAFKSMSYKIDYCREVRNLLNHNPRINEEYMVVPSDEMIELMDAVIEKLKKTRTAIEICVPADRVYSACITDPVRPAMATMHEKGYTQVPIMENGRVKGTFSADVLLTAMVESEILEIKADTSFSEISKYLPLDSHTSEEFTFIKRNESADLVAEYFQNKQAEGKRVGMAFVTQNGSPDEKLQGIITAWDLLGIG